MRVYVEQPSAHGPEFKMKSLTRLVTEGNYVRQASPRHERAAKPCVCDALQTVDPSGATEQPAAQQIRSVPAPH